MKLHIPVSIVVYQEIEIDDTDEIQVIDMSSLTEEQSAQVPEFVKKMNIPAALKPDAWERLLAKQVVAGEVVSGLLAGLSDMREKNPGLKAEMTPCFGTIPFKDLN